MIVFTNNLLLPFQYVTFYNEYLFFIKKLIS